jgi:hypothetical protein
MPADAPSPDWNKLVSDLTDRFRSLTDHVLEDLSGLLVTARDMVRASESGLLVPADDAEGHLRFLVSVNSSPEANAALRDIRVPCDRSLVGFVYNTGQLVAIANPEDYYQEVDAKTGLKTEIYFAAPMMNDDEILGVITFLNRPPGEPQELFTEEELEAGQRFASLAAAALRYYDRACLQEQLFLSELRETVEQQIPEAQFSGTLDDAPRDASGSLVARAILQLEKLSPSSRLLAAELIDVLVARRELESTDL